jgi:hypothetical protein
MPGDVTTTDFCRTNALDDLLDAERHFRQQAESVLRDLRSVLTELAQRVAGAQIEEARRTDPTAPESWGPDRWRKFFANLPARSVGSGWNDNILAELEQLRSENQALKGKLAATALSTPRSPILDNVESGERPTVVIQANTPPELPEIVAPLPVRTAEIDTQSRAFAHANFLSDLRSLRLPAAPPARFESHFPKAGLNEADWERQLRRKLYVLYLLSQGMDIRLEVDYLLSQVEGIGSRTGALRRIYDNMVEKNLLSREILEMSAPNTSLAMLQLTEDGRQLCEILGWGVAESERQRMNRLHQGIQYPQHTLGVMIFAMHTRFRGYQVNVMPHIEGIQTHAIPDVAIIGAPSSENTETIYVEVELSNKELDEKWRNQVQLQKRVALCARNAQRRGRLVGDCKLKNLHGLATDLEMLIACKVPDISQGTPLWAEEW